MNRRHLSVQENMLRTDLGWGQHIPPFIAYSPLMDPTSPAALQGGLALMVIF